MVRTCVGLLQGSATQPCVFNSTHAGNAAQPPRGRSRCIFCDFERLDEVLEKPGVRTNLAARLRVPWPRGATCRDKRKTARRALRRSADVARRSSRASGHVAQAFKTQNMEVFHAALARLGEVTADVAELEALADARPACPPRKRPAAAPLRERSRCHTSVTASSSDSSSRHSRSEPCLAEARDGTL